MITDKGRIWARRGRTYQKNIKQDYDWHVKQHIGAAQGPSRAVGASLGGRNEKSPPPPIALSPAVQIPKYKKILKSKKLYLPYSARGCQGCELVKYGFQFRL